MTEADAHIVVVGAGQAGLQAAETLRAGGFEGRVTLVGSEPHAPYHRPPLSKGWLSEALDARQLAIRDVSALERKNIDLRVASHVAEIDANARAVRLQDDSRIAYSGLVLATGATPRMLGNAAPADGTICALRSREDASAIAKGLRNCLQARLPLVVIGGGFIGLEVAASARKLGADVVVLEAAPRLLQRALSRELSDWYARLHASHGVTLVLDARIDKVETSGSTAQVRLIDGRRWEAGLVLVGVGIIPNDELARRAGIACDNGIIVDACSRTSIAGIVAAGDCTVCRLPDGSMRRLESVQSAVEQGRAAAYTLLGMEKPFTGTPWFWSDQYDAKLQIAGLSRSADRSVARGDMAGKSFSIFHYAVDRLVAVDSINAARDHVIARQLIGVGVSPTIDQVSDISFDLGRLRPA